ncbi:hypothetical protein BD779DRAFT_1478332 [Infundibulicybe gibba]|nr:hypothetical protein BD779DRAFT_1478332 [Infundibulicybe gibba]
MWLRASANTVASVECGVLWKLVIPLQVSQTRKRAGGCTVGVVVKKSCPAPKSCKSYCESHGPGLENTEEGTMRTRWAQKVEEHGHGMVGREREGHAEWTDHQTQELARMPTGTLPQTRASTNTSHGAIHAREAPSVTTCTVPGPHEVHTYRVEPEPAQERITKRPDYELDPSQLQSRAYRTPAQYRPQNTARWLTPGNALTSRISLAEQGSERDTKTPQSISSTCARPTQTIRQALKTSAGTPENAHTPIRDLPLRSAQNDPSGRRSQLRIG